MFESIPSPRNVSARFSGKLDNDSMALARSIPWIRSIGVRTEDIPTGLQRGSVLAIEYDGHKIDYRLTDISHTRDLPEPEITRVDLEIAKVHY